MPLRIACKCGKILQVRDELAGKKVRCPGCQGVLAVPTSNGSPAVKAGAPKPAAAPRASASLVKPAPKPPAKRPAPPDEEEDNLDEQPVRAKRRPAPPPEEEENDVEEDEDRPARRKKKKKRKAGLLASLPLWVLIAAPVGLVVVLVGGFFLVWWLVSPGSGPVAQKKSPQALPPINERPVDIPKVPPGGGNNQGPVTSTNLADLVPGDALFFATVSGEFGNVKALEEFRKVFEAQGEAEFQKIFGFPSTDMDRISIFTVTDYQEAKPRQVVPVVVLLQGKKPFDQQAVTAALKKSDLGKNPQIVFEFLNDRTLVSSLEPLLQIYKGKLGKHKAGGVLQRALDQAGKSTGIVASVVIPPELLQDLQADPKGIPAEAQELFKPFFKTKEVFLSLDVTDKVELNASLVLEDAEAAQGAKTAVDALLTLANVGLAQMAKDPQTAPMVEMAKKTLKELKIAAQDKELSVNFQTDATVLAGLFMPAIQKVREAAALTQQLNNLKQIAIAWHNFHDANKMFPPQTFNKGLSWRVAILPYFGEEQLYQQFKLDEPWDSEHNKKLIPLMPKVYEPVLLPGKPGFTYVQTFVGPKTVNNNPTSGTRIQQIIDGTSNTLLFTEAATAVEWTRPVDIAVNPGRPIQLGESQPGFFLAAFADGSVRRLSRQLNQNVLRLLIDPADGQRIPPLNFNP